MTVTTARKKVKAKKKVSTGAVKGQVAQQRAQNDQLRAMTEKQAEMLARQAESMDALMNQLQATQKEVAQLKSRQDADDHFANHDPNAKMINDVLGRKVDEQGVPEKPKAELPDALQRAVREATILARKAKDNPVTKAEEGLDTLEMHIGNVKPRTMLSVGPARESLSALLEVDHDITIDTKRYSPGKIDEMLFMHEWVLIRVHQTTDKTAIPIPETNVNGRSQYYMRGVPQWVRRYHVERLARAKRTDYQQEKYTDSAGVTHIKELPTTELEYPFTVLKDENPLGARWLEGILAQGL